MKKTNNFYIMAAVLLTSMIIGFVSCGKENQKPEEQDLSCADLMGKWAKWITHDVIEPLHFIEFKPNGTYSYVNANETINGFYKVTEKEKGIYDLLVYNPFDGNEYFSKFDGTLYKMNVSGSNVYDRMFVYFLVETRAEVYYYIYIQLYSGDNLVQNFWKRFFIKLNIG